MTMLASPGAADFLEAPSGPTHNKRIVIASAGRTRIRVRRVRERIGGIRGAVIVDPPVYSSCSRGLPSLRNPLLGGVDRPQFFLAEEHAVAFFSNQREQRLRGVPRI